MQTLTATELDLGRMPITIDPQPRRRVNAWVRFGDTPVQVDAVAARWTARAVGLEFEIKDQKHRCWVGEGAAESIDS